MGPTPMSFSRTVSKLVLEDPRWQLFQASRAMGPCYNQSARPLLDESSPGLCVNERAWPCFRRTSFIETGRARVCPQTAGCRRQATASKGRKSWGASGAGAEGAKVRKQGQGRESGLAEHDGGAGQGCSSFRMTEGHRQPRKVSFPRTETGRSFESTDLVIGWVDKSSSPIKVGLEMNSGWVAC